MDSLTSRTTRLRKGFSTPTTENQSVSGGANGVAFVCCEQTFVLKQQTASLLDLAEPFMLQFILYYTCMYPLSHPRTS